MTAFKKKFKINIKDKKMKPHNVSSFKPPSSLFYLHFQTLDNIILHFFIITCDFNVMITIINECHYILNVNQI